MTQTKPQPTTELQAFCPTCPAVADVIALLGGLGLHLDFQMEEQRDHSGQLPPLPAQFHFKDVHGTEVIYLAGRDFPLNESGEAFPAHASRFWLYTGADRLAFQRARTTLSFTFQVPWRDPSEAAGPGHEEVA